MKTLLLNAVAAVAIMVMSNAAHAMPVDTMPANEPNSVEAVAVCFYLDGWNGPGIYQCGYRQRHGLGWVREREERREEFREERRGPRIEFREREEYRDRGERRDRGDRRERWER